MGPEGLLGKDVPRTEGLGEAGRSRAGEVAAFMEGFRGDLNDMGWLGWLRYLHNLLCDSVLSP